MEFLFYLLYNKNIKNQRNNSEDNKIAITKKDVKELINKYADRITYIDSKENPEEYSRFETEVLDDVILDLENLLNKEVD